MKSKRGLRVPTTALTTDSFYLIHFHRSRRNPNGWVDSRELYTCHARRWTRLPADHSGSFRSHVCAVAGFVSGGETLDAQRIHNDPDAALQWQDSLC